MSSEFATSPSAAAPAASPPTVPNTAFVVAAAAAAVDAGMVVQPGAALQLQQPQPVPMEVVAATASFMDTPTSVSSGTSTKPKNARGKGRTRKRATPRAPAKPVVPPFLLKTFSILSNPAFSEQVSWNEAGDGILVKHIADFSAKVLPLYFKHSRWTSFVRQLHIYGFKKWADRKGDNQVEFRNPQFTRTGRDVLHTIKRRVIPANSDTSDPSKPRAKRRRRTTTTLTNDQARLLIVTLAKQEEVLQRVERLEAANHHLSNVNDCLSWELLRLRRATRKPTATVCGSASRLCAASGTVLVDQLHEAATLAAMSENMAASNAGSVNTEAGSGGASTSSGTVTTTSRR